MTPQRCRSRVAESEAGCQLLELLLNVDALPVRLFELQCRHPLFQLRDTLFGMEKLALQGPPVGFVDRDAAQKQPVVLFKRGHQNLEHSDRGPPSVPLEDRMHVGPGVRLQGQGNLESAPGNRRGQHGSHQDDGMRLQAQQWGCLPCQRIEYRCKAGKEGLRLGRMIFVGRIHGSITSASMTRPRRQSRTARPFEKMMIAPFLVATCAYGVQLHSVGRAGKVRSTAERPLEIGEGCSFKDLLLRWR